MKPEICIIDDDLVSQFATLYCIEQHFTDFHIIRFDNAKDALSYFNSCVDNGEELPYIIFLDLVMDEMDGWTFLEKLDSLAEGIRKPDIYILSAFTKIEDRSHAKTNHKIAGFFDKPLTKTMLNKVLTKDLAG